MVYNDTSHGRTPLNLAISNDGEHFHDFATLENGPAKFSYPALVQARNGDLLQRFTSVIEIIPCSHSHVGLFVSIRIAGDPSFSRCLLKRSFTTVAIEIVWRRIVSHEETRMPAAVQVCP